MTAFTLWCTDAGCSSHALTLYSLHLARRFGECLGMHKFSEGARMPLHLWAAGMLHYTLAPWCHLLRNPSASPSSQVQLLWLCGFFLVVVCNIGQSAAHAQLARLRPATPTLWTLMCSRKNRSGSHQGEPDYPLPDGPLFRITWSPHYCFEIGIYLGLVFLVMAQEKASFSPMQVGPCLLLLAWVTANLTASSAHTRTYYKKVTAERRPRKAR